jgi:hypothetical protein
VLAARVLLLSESLSLEEEESVCARAQKVSQLIQ